jgi:CRISPR-associated endonuclease/helicase Cas3
LLFLRSLQIKQYYNYWGKAKKCENLEYTYHLLVYHCLDVAAVGSVLLSHDSKLCKNLSAQTGLSPQLIRYLIGFTMMMHDAGKFSKTFQSLSPELYKQHFPGLKIRNYKKRHDTLGFLIWQGDEKDDPKSISNMIAGKNKSLAKILGYLIKCGFGHHGLPPLESTNGGNFPLFASEFFDEQDCSATLEYVFECMILLGDIPELPSNVKSFKRVLNSVSWQIAGLNIITDWIGSNNTYFPYCSKKMSLQDYWQMRALPQAKKALADIGWRSSSIGVFPGVNSLFPFITEPTPLQEFSINMELNKGPKLIILEDVTGAGKTEAAIILASRIMSAGEAEGLYIGLPTMATANDMYNRMQKAYRKLYSDSQTPSLILSHGARHLSRSFSESVIVKGQAPDFSYGDEATGSAMCNEWYADNRKKALLADVGVGTIDQALMGVLPARHQSLRLLGLSRKILIIDEVHAYDPYMNHLLEVLIEAHGRGGGTLILLSATIPLKKRTRLIMAFRKGLHCNEENLEIELEPGFPSLTQASASHITQTTLKSRKEVCRHVDVSFIHDYHSSIDLIIKKAEAGECVCWIRNTVRDARETYQDLLKRGVPQEKIALFHSRFAMVDRIRIEEKAMAHFGKKSGPAERQGRILIATQVVEQSLDLDFDTMITDLAPIDLLIQRAGRLHRHVRKRNGEVKKAPGAADERGTTCLHVFAPKFEEEADSQWLSGEFAGTAAVYQDIGILWRTQRLFFDIGVKRTGWSMPEDARELIETVYGEGCRFDVPEGLINKVCNAEGKVKSEESMGHLNALMLEKGYSRNAVKADQWDEDERVPTRLTEENLEVVLAVEFNNTLQPYAKVKPHGWDWSTLSVSARDWERAAYVLPEEYVCEVESLKNKYIRLKYCEIVIVTDQSDSTTLSDQQISDYYHPHLGWGEFNREE